MYNDVKDLNKLNAFKYECVSCALCLTFSVIPLTMTASFVIHEPFACLGSRSVFSEPHRFDFHPAQIIQMFIHNFSCCLFVLSENTMKVNKKAVF